MNFAGDQAADLAVQGTNTSSITSKRSLERLGYLDQSHVPGVTEKDSPLMLKYVVPKPSRRSPVINRAYYQRTESIRKIVEGWIEQCEQLGIAECAIVSLGCGFDPTYFRLATLRKNTQSATKLRYVDIDYPTLITERLYMVRNEDTLFDLLPDNAIVDDVGSFVSDTYSCLGIDLRDLRQLESGLESAQVKKNGGRIPILVISEVVLAYLAPDESDALLQFFAGYSEATFILHEQCIPTFDEQEEDQNLHPFALTMFRHFERTMTPLKTLREYRSLYDQLDRFERLGWPRCDILNMNLVSDEIVLQSPEEHQRICSLEPFDEYDEQFWIGAYYFIAIATTGPKAEASTTPSQSPNVLRALGLLSKIQTWNSSNSLPEGSFASLSKTTSEPSAIPSQPIEWTAHNPIAGLEINRKGHTLSIMGDEAFIFGGFGLDPNDAVEDQKVFQQRSQQTRLGSMIQYNLVTGASRTHPREEDGPAPRMHHSAATTLDGSAIYMYGGRDGPTKVHNDVWRYTAEGGWDPLWRARISQESDASCPKGLFKHTANMMTIAGRQMMVVFGGRLASGEANFQVFAFDLQEGQWGEFKWRSEQDQQKFGGVFSHSAVVTQDANHQECLLVVGGIRMSNEQVLNTVCQITLGVETEELPRCWVEAQALDIRASTGEPLKPRFGHSAVAVDSDRIWILGGVSSPGLLQWHETMVEIQPRRATFETLKPSCFRELVMVGHATALDAKRQRIVGTGGGGTCFGFGAWWDASAWGIHIQTMIM
ncbi:Leucine carboxyl methyltransferase 2 [Podila minutissima]|nr:Leucine carboxyl methyltransferase 2 [Podila minutissima]